MPLVKPRPKGGPLSGDGRSSEQKTLSVLSEVLWKHGDVSTEHCRCEIAKAGLSIDDITPAMIHNAEERNAERLREGFRNTNTDPDQPTKVVVIGDSEFDPAINPTHPIRGSAKMRQDKKDQQEVDQKEQEGKQDSSNEKKPPRPKSQEGKKPKGQRYDLFGFAVTAVLRWMGSQGWTVDDAKKVIAHYKIDCALATIKIQVKAGAKGERGDPAVLTPEQARELSQVVGRDNQTASKKSGKNK